MIILSFIDPEIMSFHPKATDRHAHNCLQFGVDPDDPCLVGAVMKDRGMRRVRYSVLWGQWGWAVREGILEMITFELS